MEKNEAAVALGKLRVAKYGREDMSRIGKLGMASRWYGHIKKEKIKRGNSGKKKSEVKTDSQKQNNVPSESI